jgi:asparagine synthetase B (glutamine-hydrolysing)
LSTTGEFNKSIPSETHPLNVHTASVRLLKDHLRESLKFRILNVPVPPSLDAVHNVRIAILFSGGLDCTVLARMAHDLLPSDQQIDLINVAFENPRVVQAAKAIPLKSKKHNKHESNSLTIPQDDDYPSMVPIDSTELLPYESCPDRETGRKSFQELQVVCPGRVWRFIAVRSYVSLDDVTSVADNLFR